MYVRGAADYSTEQDIFIYCGVNSHWESHTMELPILPRGLVWSIYASSECCEKKGRRITDRKLLLGPRSLSVLISQKEE